MAPEYAPITIPRFLSFIDFAYLLEGIRVADNHFLDKIERARAKGDSSAVANLNSTRQSLFRAAFVSAFSTLEQNLDELMEMAGQKAGATISLGDLKDRGVQRSVTYAQKVLGQKVDLQATHWQGVFALQAIRNHLVHYGPSFADTPDHAARIKKFSCVQLVELKPDICFNMEQLEEITGLFTACVLELGTGSVTR